MLSPDATEWQALTRPRSGTRGRYLQTAAVGVLLGVYLLSGLNWREALLAALVYGIGSFLLWQLPPPAWSLRLRRFWTLAFAFDLSVKAFLVSVYQTKPDAVLIIDSISNTNSQESWEFIAQYWRLIGEYLAAAALFAALLLWLQAPAGGGPSPRARTAAVIVLLLAAILQLNPTFRSSNPLYFWPSQIGSYTDFQDRLTMLGQKRRLAQQQLPAWQPVYTGPERDTVAVVLGESTSRWNWQLYGYERSTTPELEHEADDLLVFRDVISGAGGTIASFRLMLTPRDLHDKLDDESAPSVVLLAKAAGYKTFWISNQQDRYINPRFAAEADVTHLINTGGGRGDRKLDEGVLPYWEQALRDPAPRKLIVVHLLGAHPHYEMRSPPAFKRFDSEEDAVDRELKAAGRNAWVRYERNAYDDAMLYQDHIIATLLRGLKRDVGTGNGAFLYTSDHAQEVGHSRDFAGHSGDEAGQVVPLLIWLSSPLPAGAAQTVEQRPFQTDRLDWTLLDLLHIKTRRDAPGASLLAADYQAVPRFLVNHPRQPYSASHRARGP